MRLTRSGLIHPAATARRRLLGSITHVATNEAVAAITFDDGPHPVDTPRVLDVLARYRAQATFFMVGKYAQRYPQLVRQVVTAGHVVANHSWDHPSFPLINSRERRRQLYMCGRALAPYGGRLFRPPFGEQNVASRLDTLLAGYNVIGWSVDVGDWYEQDAAAMADKLVARVQPGSILLLHDTLRGNTRADLEPSLSRSSNVDRSAMVEALDSFLARVAGSYRFVTVPVLLRWGRPQRQAWFRTTSPSASRPLPGLRA